MALYAITTHTLHGWGASPLGFFPLTHHRCVEIRNRGSPFAVYDAIRHCNPYPAPPRSSPHELSRPDGNPPHLAAAAPPPSYCTRLPALHSSSRAFKGCAAECSTVYGMAGSRIARGDANGSAVARALLGAPRFSGRRPP